MCGIIGYVGNRITTDVLIDGLKSLEYRGYDSSGICISDLKSKKVIKSVGRVSDLEKKIKKESLLKSSYGIAHTRWATNGCANEVNSHPHTSGRITLVHNGIIENADILKKKLETEGYVFKSETDSEVVAALIDNKLKCEIDIKKAINSASKELKGSYALVIMLDNDGKLYTLRKDSPLIIGVSDLENFVASDITAISKYTNKYMFLEEGEVAVIDKNTVSVYKDGKVISKEIKENKIVNNETSKNGFDHYMLKEIMEEPIVLERLINRYIKDNDNLDISKYKEINIVACGSAMYAGMVGKYLIEEYADIRVFVEAASEYRYNKKIFNDKKSTLVILISQSGETADTIAALRESKKLGIDTLGIVNNPNSTIARESDETILTDGGVEVAVATTKAYILQVAVLSMIAIKTAIKKNLVDSSYMDKFSEVETLIKKVLKNSDSYKKIASKIYNMDSCFYIGRGVDYAISLEGSLKLKEVSYIHSEAYPAGELKHGTISLIENEMVVFTVVTNEKIKEKTISNLKETEARGARGVIITTSSLDSFDDYLKIVVDDTDDFLTPLVVMPALQLLAYYVALYRGCDIDKPRNLAKSVTVE